MFNIREFVLMSALYRHFVIPLSNRFVLVSYDRAQKSRLSRVYLQTRYEEFQIVFEASESPITGNVNKNGSSACSASSLDPSDQILQYSKDPVVPRGGKCSTRAHDLLHLYLRSQFLLILVDQVTLITYRDDHK